MPLRTFLGATDQWLGLLPAIHQRHDTPGEVRAFLGGTVYPDQREDYEKYFEIRNNEAAVEELERTMIAGGVPVFHVRSASRTLLMNKAVEIGEVKEGYGATEVLTVATAFVTDHKDAILAAVREEILRD